MKKSIFLFLFILSITFVYAETCPFGEVDDAYPGECGRYIDNDQNNLCDLSEVKQETQKGQTYNTLIITIITIFVYLISYFSLRNRIIIHKKIWNMLLLISFILVAFTSIVYLLKIDFAFDFEISKIAFWHIEIGIVMILISIFHALWHISYFKRII